jgi:hypothetical protein
MEGSAKDTCNRKRSENSKFDSSSSDSVNIPVCVYVGDISMGGCREDAKCVKYGQSEPKKVRNGGKRFGNETL